MFCMQNIWEPSNSVPELIRMADNRKIASEIVNCVRALQRIGPRQSAEFVQKYRITGQQLGALRIVERTPAISLRELSERMYLHISTVSGIVDRLEKRGYLSRKRSSTDRRVVHLHTSAEGRRVIKKTPLAGMGLLFHNIDKLPPAQLREIAKALRLILNVMEIEC
jgi:DNA-binding MarR family transcriptional regulator